MTSSYRAFTVIRRAGADDGGQADRVPDLDGDPTGSTCKSKTRPSSPEAPAHAADARTATFGAILRQRTVQEAKSRH